MIFPGKLDWNSNDLWGECFFWFFIFLVAQTVCFSFVLLVEYLTSKFCCKQSVEIVTFRELDAKRLGSLKGHGEKT